MAAEDNAGLYSNPIWNRNIRGRCFTQLSGTETPQGNLQRDYREKTIIALSLAAFSLSFAVPAYAANVACKPPKNGMVDGKCVAIIGMASAVRECEAAKEAMGH
jgi:hypothetical protein